MDPKIVLRIEGIALFGAATAAYVVLGGPLWLFLVLALAPDLSMVGYLAGPRAGSTLYNAFHTYVAPIVVGTVGVLAGVTPLLWVALVWAAHIGMDRAVGYGLKYPGEFGHTHLGGGAHDQAVGDDVKKQKDPIAERANPILEATDPVPARDD